MYHLCAREVQSREFWTRGPHIVPCCVVLISFVEFIWTCASPRSHTGLGMKPGNARGCWKDRLAKWIACSCKRKLCTIMGKGTRFCVICLRCHDVQLYWKYSLPVCGVGMAPRMKEDKVGRHKSRWYCGRWTLEIFKVEIKCAWLCRCFGTVQLPNGTMFVFLFPTIYC